MKAIRAVRPLGIAMIAGLVWVTAACTSKREAPPAPAPRPSPSARPLPAPPPQSAVDWRDAPITPGTWRWGMEGSRSVARFGNNALVLSCNHDAGTVTLIRPGNAEAHEVAGAVPITVITSTGRHNLSGQDLAGPPPVVALALRANDGLLDAMAFSRGRFAVETAGLPTLYIPSWPEVSRVIEDCR